MADKLDGDSVVGTLLSGFGSPTLLCVIGSRMFFNLKEAAEHGVNVGTNWSSYEHSTMRFNESDQRPEYVIGAFFPPESLEINDPFVLFSAIQSGEFQSEDTLEA